MLLEVRMDQLIPQMNNLVEVTIFIIVNFCMLVLLGNDLHLIII